MEVNKIYEEDLRIAHALIRRDEQMTKRFFYNECSPMLITIYKNYETDCNSLEEFINEIYLTVLAPSKVTGKCQMENFRGESTLKSWLQTACLYYCFGKYKLKIRMPKQQPMPSFNAENKEATDRTEAIYGSNDIDFDDLNRLDAMTIINLMPNIRYRTLIRLRYLEQKTNEETAEALGMTMSNYYNKHKLAKDQYIDTWRKEEQHD